MVFRTIQYKRYIKLRIIATLIDYGFYLVFFFVYVYSLGNQNDDGVMEVKGLLALPVFIVWFLYFVVTETVNKATPGHNICKLMVIRSNGEPVSFWDCVKRRIVDIIDIGIWGIPALICICNTPKFQRLGDLLADTVVVKKTDILITEETS
jgi:uncharacterized RDD family membrane protein YckC